MHFSASRSLTQPLFDCMRTLYLMLTRYPYDPGTLPGSADQCILGNVYLRSNLSREHVSEIQSIKETRPVNNLAPERQCIAYSGVVPEPRASEFILNLSRIHWPASFWCLGLAPGTLGR